MTQHGTAAVRLDAAIPSPGTHVVGASPSVPLTYHVRCPLCGSLEVTACSDLLEPSDTVPFAASHECQHRRWPADTPCGCRFRYTPPSLSLQEPACPT